MADIFSVIGVLVAISLCVAIIVKLDKKSNSKVGMVGDYVSQGCEGLEGLCPYGMDGCPLPCARAPDGSPLQTCCDQVCPRDSHGTPLYGQGDAPEGTCLHP